MLRKILDWIKPKALETSTPLKTLRDVDVFDTVWLLDNNGNIYNGWVFDKSRRHLIVTSLIDGELTDYRFILNVPLSSTEITQEHKTLYFNQPCNKEI